MYICVHSIMRTSRPLHLHETIISVGSLDCVFSTADKQWTLISERVMYLQRPICHTLLFGGQACRTVRENGRKSSWRRWMRQEKICRAMWSWNWSDCYSTHCDSKIATRANLGPRSNEEHRAILLLENCRSSFSSATCILLYCRVHGTVSYGRPQYCGCQVLHSFL